MIHHFKNDIMRSYDILKTSNIALKGKNISSRTSCKQAKHLARLSKFIYLQVKKKLLLIM